MSIASHLQKMVIVFPAVRNIRSVKRITCSFSIIMRQMGRGTFKNSRRAVNQMSRPATNVHGCRSHDGGMMKDK